ncbi:hypothetical protein RSOL_407030, partial [Rhizoctonia solani AG-3 Rhs1AP]
MEHEFIHDELLFGAKGRYLRRLRAIERCERIATLMARQRIKRQQEKFPASAAQLETRLTLQLRNIREEAAKKHERNTQALLLRIEKIHAFLNPLGSANCVTTPSTLDLLVMQWRMNDHRLQPDHHHPPLNFAATPPTRLKIGARVDCHSDLTTSRKPHPPTTGLGGVSRVETFDAAPCWINAMTTGNGQLPMVRVRSLRPPSDAHNTTPNTTNRGFERTLVTVAKLPR